ncbi:hypothetical protein NQ317_006338 [Molorchus minor]|uniref:Integrase catalytic domain-containing protein n=1 Tax=Molorchus minor TaxID=1323400 RepID=A0ABQ9IUD0_9CUCU|nr:hypothetical protein NQ317_006338 [Molorchus minor]
MPIINLITTSLPRILITINGQQILALVDTGAALNALSTRVQPIKDHQAESRLIGLACGNQSIATYGERSYQIGINGRDYPITFAILGELSEDAILGMPFLKAQNVLLDCPRRCIYLGNTERKTVFWHMTPEPQISEELPEDLNIPAEVEPVLTPLFSEFAELFTDNPTPSTTISTKHVIRLKDDKIVNKRPYPMTPQKKEAMYDQIEEMLGNGIIEPSTSPYSSPPVMVERPGCGKQVGAYIKKCLICLQTKGRQVQPHAALRPHTATAPFQKISIDILGPYPETKTKNRYVILVSDIFTKWVEAKAYPLVNAKDVIKFLDAEIIPRFGVPNTIISDNGPQFIAANYENWARRLNINLLRVAIYHQRANPVERRVQEFKKLMRLHLLKRSQRLWDEQLPRILYVLRTRQNAATQHTPSSLLYGYEIPRRGEWNVPAFREAATDRSPAPERFEEADQAQRAYQEKYTEPKPLPVEFNPGDLVMVRQFTKGREQFAIVWRGPYPIHRRVTDEVYEVEMEGTSPNIHIDDLRPAPRIGEEDSEESASDDDSSNDDSGAESEPGAVEQAPTSEMPPIHSEETPPLPAPSPKRPIPGSRRRARLIYRRKSE